MAQLQSTSITGSLIVTQGITGSFSGSISNAISASYAATASYALNAGDSVWTGSAGNIYYNGGNVGIGTASPGGKLDVNGETLFRNRITVNNTALQTYAQLNVWDPTAGSGASRLADFTNGTDNNLNIYISQVGASSKYSELASYSSNPLVFNYTAGGNVGIGTPNPVAKLYIVGSSQNTLSLDSPAYPELTFRVSGTVKSYDAIVTTNQGYFNTSTVGDRIYRTEAGNHLFGYSTTEIMRIASGGNVGIGTASPGYKLDVNGTVNVAAGNYYRIGGTAVAFVTGNEIQYGNQGGSDYVTISTGTTEKFRITTAGNVGIGTTNPTARIQIANPDAGSDGFQFQRWVYTAGTPGVYELQLKQTVTSGVVRYNFSMINSSTTYNDVLVLDRGNVGIGTTNPARKLSIVDGAGPQLRLSDGTANTFWEFYSVFYQTNQDLIIQNQNLAAVTINSVGNVGIGATVPSQKLHVVGNQYITGVITVGASGNYSNVNFVRGDGASVGGIGWRSDGSFYVGGHPDYGPTAGNRVRVYGFGELLSLGNSQAGDILNINTSGNVGIGTTSPDTKLHVFTTSNSDQELLRLTVAPANSSGAKPKAILGFYTPAEANTANYTSGRITSKFDISGYANSRVTIESLDSGGNFIETLTAKNGNVGIGTTNPTGQLTVAKQYSSYTPGEYLLKLRGGNGGIYDLVDAYYDSDAAIFRVGYAGLNNSRAVINGGTSAGGASLSLVYGSTLATFITADGTSYFNGGNVGIGTTNPTKKLHVASSANEGIFMEGTANGGHWFDFKSANSNLWSMGAQPGLMGWYNRSDSSYKMVITDGGNVGINTTSPSYKLHVESSTNAAVAVIGASGYQTSVELKGVDRWYRLISQPTAGGGGRFDIYDQTGGAYRLSINTDGNVGIGTTSPSKKLDVQGSISLGTGVGNEQGLYINVGNGTSDYSNIRFYHGGTNTQTIHSFSSTWQSGTIFSASTNAINIDGALGFTAGTWYDPDAVFVKGGATYFKGNVGIGNTAPAFKLDVNGTVRFSAEAYIAGVWSTSYGPRNSGDPIKFVDWNATELVRISTTNGNVGIGTTSPTAFLDVKGLADNAGTISLQLRSGNSATNFNSNQITLGYSNSDTYRHAIKSRHQSGAPSGNAIDFYTWAYGGSSSAIGGQHVMSLDGANVGIGTTSPSAKLHVQTSSTNLGLRLGNTNGTNWDFYSYNDSNLYINNSLGTVFTIHNSNGNVGIGTASPESKLHIAQSNAGGKVTLYIDNNASSTLNNEATIKFSVDSGASATNGGAEISTINVNAGNGNSDLTFKTFNASIGFTEKVRFTTDGNVGIGTTTPKQKLIVEGILATKPSSVDGYYSYLRSNWNENDAFELGISENGSSNFHKLITSSNYYFGSTLQFWTADVERIRIISNGNVGIGTTNPATKLQVDGALKLTSNPSVTADGSAAYFWNQGGVGPTIGGFRFQVQTNGSTTAMTIDESQNVGIGLTNPPTRLSAYRGLQTDTITIGNAAAYIWGADIGLAVGQYASGPYGTWLQSLRTDNTTWPLTLNPTGGNVGIGSSSPSYKLDVNGTFGTSGTAVFNGSATYINSSDIIVGNNSTDAVGISGNTMYFPGNGNVGIGTTSPASALHVNGTITVGATVSSFVYGTLAYVGSTDGVALSAPGQNMTLTTGYNEKLFIKSGQGGLQFQTNDGVGNYTDRLLINQTRSYFNSNVGIGITNPSFKLHVVGAVGIGQNTNGTATIDAYGGNAYYGCDGTQITVNGNSGNVGIGTTAPLFNLQVGANSGTLATTTIRLQNSYLDTNGYYGFNIEGVDNGVNGHDLRFLGRTSPTGTFSELVRIKNGGNVGIGVASPSYKLDINGVTRFQNRVRFANDLWNLSDDGYNRLYFSTNGRTYYGSGDGHEWRNASDSPIAFLTNGGNLVLKGTNAFTTGGTATLSVIGDIISLGASDSDLAYFRRLGSGQFQWQTYNSGNTGQIHLQPYGGNVGIGTTNPAQKLHVEGIARLGGSSTDGALYVYSSNGTLNSLVSGPGDTYLNATYGNVGIGTTSPSHKLTVTGDGSGTMKVGGPGVSGNYTGISLNGSLDISNYNILSSPTDNHLYINRPTGNNIYFRVNNNNQVIINSSGNVGIGTDSPTQKLEVNGSTWVSGTVYINRGVNSTEGYTYFDHPGTQVWKQGIFNDNTSTFSIGNGGGFTRLFNITNGGNVGIGITNPSYKLQVAGTSWFTAEQAISYTDSIQSMYGGTGYSLFRMYGNSNGVEMQIDTHAHNSGAATIGTYSNSDVFIKTNQTNRMVVKAGGNVGIGVTAPAAKLQVSGSTNVLNVRGSGSAVTSSIFSVDGNNGRLFEVSDDLSNSLFSVNTIAGLPVIEAFADYTVTMGTYGAYSLQVTGSRVGVGTSSPGYPLHVSGSVSGISIYATNDIAAFSDQSVKTDLQVIDSAVDKIKQINGYTYVRVDDLSNTRRAGVIAQEVQKVLPEVVSENSDGTLNVAYSNMIALLIEGMKEQQAQIDKLREDLEDLRYEL